MLCQILVSTHYFRVIIWDAICGVTQVFKKQILNSTHAGTIIHEWIRSSTFLLGEENKQVGHTIAVEYIV